MKESFEDTKIGDRFNTDSAKLYIHPLEQENLIFTARIDQTSGELWDDYVRCFISNSYKIIRKEDCFLSCSTSEIDIILVLP